MVSEKGWHGQVPLGELLFLFLLSYIHYGCSVLRGKRTEAAITFITLPHE